MSTSLDPKRTIAELKELRALTGDENGAQRVAFTKPWLEAREWLRQKVAGLPLEIHNDAAGNTWFTLRGESEKALLIGGHMDSVPNGGWLDGCLNVLAGVEVLRRIAEEGEPPVTVRLGGWADQEELRQLVDRDGVALPDALREHGVELDRAREARRQLESATAYLELHIE